MASTAILPVIGMVVLWRAVAFEGYISGLLILALAFAAFEGARELKEKYLAPEVPAAAAATDGETPSGQEPVGDPTAGP